MATGLGLRVIPSDSKEDVAAAVPIENEVMVTADEGRIHTSQIGIPDADSPLRALPFADEVVHISEGSSQGLTEHFYSALASSHKHAVVLAKTTTEAIVSDLSDKGTVSLINTETQAILGTLAPASHVIDDKFGLILSASDDLGVVAVANDVRAISIFVRSGNTYSEILAYTEVGVNVESLSVSGDGTTVAVGYPNKSNLAGMVRVYRISAGIATAYQTLFSSTAIAGELFGSSLSLSGDGVVMAAGLEGDSSEKGAVIVLADNGSTFSEVQKISVSNAVIGDKFGSSIVISSDSKLLAIGAKGRTYSGDSVLFGLGAAFVANKLGSGLFRIDQELQNSSVGSDAGLGDSIALSGDKSTLMAGAKNSNISGSLSGSVVAYTFESGLFTEAGLVIKDGFDSNSIFGHSISLDHKGEKAGVGSTKGILIAQTKSKWRKSIPEVTAEAISNGLPQQGSVSGKVMLAAILAAIEANPSGGIDVSGLSERAAISTDTFLAFDKDGVMFLSTTSANSGTPPSNTAPVINDQNLTALTNQDLVVYLSGSDADGDSLVYSITGTGVSNYAEVSNGIGVFNSSTIGAETINVSVTDGTATATATITITVSDKYKNIITIPNIEVL